MIKKKRKRKNPEIVRELKEIKKRTVKGKPREEYIYTYRYTNGQPASKKDETYAKSLRIPHKINNESLRIYPRGSRVLARYRDLKGRQIHKYSTKEISRKVQEKYKRGELFRKNSTKILGKIKKDIDPSTKQGQAALILYIISKTGLRIGSNSDTKADVKAYGISTLLNKHVKLLKNNKIKFDFIGKKGVRNSDLITDSKIHRALSKLKTEKWSQRIFNVSDTYIRNYLKSIDKRFIVKDFRTLKAYETAKKAIAKRKGPAPNEKTFKKWQKEVGDIVAKDLGNTRAIAINDYIDPKLWDKWRKPEWGPFIPTKLRKAD